jgi:hypothetical protein
MSSTQLYSVPIITPSSFKPTRLYIIKIKDLWYFGKTVKEDIVGYYGSGTVWKDKIKKYGTKAVEHVWHSDWYYDPIELQLVAIQFSLENDIVNSPGGLT